MAVTLARQGKYRGNFRGRGGASSLTRKQLRSYAIDSQALFLHLRAVAAGVGLQ
ncbi:hypothetical protein C4K19_3986 [Pseudomonas chlororaphis subsp. aurantiaca]|nr:hypothetical protein C4K19_3986 [Pseudomonas chlororaphis subsp. aurantiaca]